MAWTVGDRQGANSRSRQLWSPSLDGGVLGVVFMSGGGPEDLSCVKSDLGVKPICHGG